MRIIMIALLVLAPQAMAASLVTDGNGKVTGINELTIQGVNYDVTFYCRHPARTGVTTCRPMPLS
jgi:hypothetical protein